MEGKHGLEKEGATLSYDCKLTEQESTFLIVVVYVPSWGQVKQERGRGNEVVGVGALSNSIVVLFWPPCSFWRHWVSLPKPKQTIS